MKSTVERWIEMSTYDLDTAKAMFDSGRHIYVVFCCQQALEKLIKAVFANKIQEMPPRIHHLARLCELSDVVPEEKDLDFLRELSACYLESRYPVDCVDPSIEISEDDSRKILEESERIWKWFRSLLP